MTVVVLLVAGALVWAPGALIARAYGMGAGRSLVFGPALTWGAVGLAALLVPRAGLGWSPLTATGFLAVLAVPTVPGAVRRRRRRTGTAHAAARRRETPLRELALAGAGVVAAAAVLTTMLVRAAVRPGDVDQLWDAVWHANLTGWIARTGSSDPTRAPGQLLSAGWRTVATYYPDALHAGAALVVQLTGAGVPLALGSVVLVVYVVLLPLASATLVWTLTRGSGAGAGAAASCSVLAVVYPTDHWWRGEWPYGVALAVALLVAALLVEVLQGRAVAGSWWRPAVLAALGLIGLAALQPAGAVVAVGVVAAWAGGQLLRLPWRWALTGTAAVVWLAWAAADAVRRAETRSPVLASLGAHDYRTLAGPGEAFTEALQLVRQVDPTLGYPVPVQAPQQGLLAVFAVSALVVLTSRRTAWLAAVEALLLAAAADTLAPVGAPLDSLTLFFYNSPYRLMAVVTAVGAVMTGVAVARVTGWCGWRRVAVALEARLRVRPGALVAGCCVVALVAGTALAAGTVARGAVRMRAGYAHRVVGPSQEAVMADLARQPLPAGARVLNDPVDGSPWIYALTGVTPMFTHYARGETPRRAVKLLHHLDEADSSAVVQEDLRRLRVCYVYAGTTPVTARRHLASGFTGLDGVRSLQLVTRTRGASLYRVLVPGTPCAQ